VVAQRTTGDAAKDLNWTAKRSQIAATPQIYRSTLLGRPPVITAVGGTLLTDTLALVMLAIVVQTAGRDSEGHWA